MAGLGASGLIGSGRFSGRRDGSLDGKNNTYRYPSPWWDVAHMDLPRTVKHLFKWCRYHMLVNPLVSATVRKMSSYPITEVIIDDEPLEGFSKNNERWQDLLFRVLDIARVQLEVGLDYNGYGNCVVSILYPFHKYLQCPQCGYRNRIERLKFKKDWDFKNWKYVLRCPKCKHTHNAKVEDKTYKSYKDIKIIRWNPSDLDIEFNPITRESEYHYKAPAKIRRKVARKNKRYLETLPSQLISAMKTNRPFVLTPENVFHFKAPTPSLEANDDGWGYPPILPALKDSFYLQVMKKAQEAVMMEHLIPLDILFPAAQDANASPYQTTNLGDWKKRIEAEIVKWRWDPNYRPIMPLPVGHQRIGGDGRALMLTQEIRTWSEHIIAGMGVPQEFVFGGLSWSGSSVSLRMLENQLLTYRMMHEHFLQHFLVPSIARFMGWKEVKMHMRDFKMADDMQMKQMLMSLNQTSNVSSKTLLAEFGKDSLDETKLLEQEMGRKLELQKSQQLLQAQAAGEAQLIQTKYQIKAQEMMTRAQVLAARKQQAGQQQAMQQQQAGQQQAMQQQASSRQVNVLELASAYAKRIGRMPPEERAAVLQKMQQSSPQLHDVVQQKMSESTAMAQEPLPEQRPPRRAGQVI